MGGSFHSYVSLPEDTPISGNLHMFLPSRGRRGPFAARQRRQRRLRRPWCGCGRGRRGGRRQESNEAAGSEEGAE